MISKFYAGDIQFFNLGLFCGACNNSCNFFYDNLTFEDVRKNQNGVTCPTRRQVHFTLSLARLPPYARVGLQLLSMPKSATHTEPSTSREPKHWLDFRCRPCSTLG